MHTKRQTVSRKWPIPRKGTKYVVVPSHDKKNGIPILIILRDILKLASNRKEVRKILQEKAISLNGKIIQKENLSILPFDVIKIGNKNHQLGFSDKGKFEVKETSADERTLRVTGKKILKGKKVQLNLLYGNNVLADKDVKTGNSVVIKEGKIVKVVEMEKGKKAIVLSGKYRGRQGKIDKLEGEIATISYDNKKINIPSKNIMVLG